MDALDSRGESLDRADRWMEDWEDFRFPLSLQKTKTYKMPDDPLFCLPPPPPASKNHLKNLVEALEEFGCGQSMMHPRLTKALNKAKKSLTKTQN